MITELSSGIGTVLFRNCRSLQEEGNLPSSQTGCRLLWRKKEIFPHHGRAADFFGGVEPPEQPTSLEVSMHHVDASVTSSGQHTYDHRTLFCYWNSFIPQLPESRGRRKSSLITDGLQTSLEVLNRRATKIPCSVDASVTSGQHTYDHRTLFWYWNSFIPQLPQSTGRRKSSLITDGLQTSLEVLNRRSNQHPLQCRCISDFFWKKEIFPHHGRVADFFGGVEPPEQPTSLAVSMHQKKEIFPHHRRAADFFGGVEPPEQPTSLAVSMHQKKEIFPHHGRAADFFGGVEPPEQPTSLEVSMHQ
ncbi:hypothetical protein TNCV_4729001 [Trichonephila clavipes]|nr:hypothetical protein TNCV_4729001 [Trichonephila clavipes]